MTDDPQRIDVGRWRWRLLDLKCLSPTEQHVALALAVRMNADGAIPSKFAPGIRTLARDTGRRTETVNAALLRLEELGYLEVVRHGNGYRSEYRTTVPPTGDATVPRGGDAYPFGLPSEPSPAEEEPSPLQEEPSPVEEETVPPRGDTTSTTSTTSTSTSTTPARPDVVPIPQGSSEKTEQVLEFVFDKLNTQARREARRVWESKDRRQRQQVAEAIDLDPLPASKLARWLVDNADINGARDVPSYVRQMIRNRMVAA